MTSKKWMLIAVLAFCALAISVKEIGDQINSFQIIFFRSLFGLVVLLPFVKQRLTKVDFASLKRHGVRNLFHLIGQYGWIVGIVYLPLAEVTAIEFSVPVWVLIIATIFLKEKLNSSKVLSVGLGFIGVLLVLKPGFKAISSESIIVLLSAVCYGIAHVSTKKIVQTNSPFDVVFIMCLIQSPIALCFSFKNWGSPTVLDSFWMAMVGLMAIVAHFSLAKAIQVKDISSVISMDYLRLPILIVVGILIYNEPFELFLLLGGSIIFFASYLNKILSQNLTE